MKLFLLLLPTVTFATVDVRFGGTIDFNRGQVRGVFDATKQANSEGSYLTDKVNMLKDIIEVSNGKRPDELYLTSPENQSNMYKENGLKEVKRRIVPIEVNAIQVKTKDILATKKPYDNYEDKPKKAIIDVFLMIQNKVTSAWMNVDHTFSDKVHLDLKFRVNCGKTEIDQTFEWGHKKIARVTDLMQEKEETVIAPGEEVIAELHAKIGLVQFTIDYNVSVTGDVIAVYNDMYKGKRYHIFNIVDLMATKGIKSSQIATQIVSYQFYYGAFLKIVESKAQVSEKNKKKLSGTPITDTKDRDEIATPKFEGLGKIKMASKSKIEKYVLEDIGENMYTGLEETEKSDEQSDSSEDSV